MWSLILIEVIKFLFQAKNKLYPLLSVNNNGATCKMKPSEVFKVIDEVEILWKSHPVQAAYKNRNTFILDDSAGYFLSRARKIMNDEYLPTNEDILHTRVKTFGVVTHEFELHQKNGPQSGKIIMVRNFHILMILFKTVLKWNISRKIIKIEIPIPF